MELTRRTIEGVVVIDVSGRVCGAKSEETHLNTMIEDQFSRHETLLVFNFDNVEFLNSSGMGVFIKAYTSIHRMGGHAAFVRSDLDRIHDSPELFSDSQKMTFSSEARAISVLKNKTNK